MAVRLSAGSIGALVFAAVLVAVAAGSVSGVEPTEGTATTELATIERAPSSNFPDATIGSLSEPLRVVGTSLKLMPPSFGHDTVPIPGSEAVRIAEGEFGPTAFPREVTANLAAEGDAGRPVWAVSFTGLCVPAFGPPGSEDRGCGNSVFVVIVDATTGEVDIIVSTD